jgi:hypothetical protein
MANQHVPKMLWQESGDIFNMGNSCTDRFENQYSFRPFTHKGCKAFRRWPGRSLNIEAPGKIDPVQKR